MFIKFFRVQTCQRRISASSSVSELHGQRPSCYDETRYTRDNLPVAHSLTAMQKSKERRNINVISVDFARADDVDNSLGDEKVTAEDTYCTVYASGGELPTLTP